MNEKKKIDGLFLLVDDKSESLCKYKQIFELTRLSLLHDSLLHDQTPSCVCCVMHNSFSAIFEGLCIVSRGLKYVRSDSCCALQLERRIKRTRSAWRRTACAVCESVPTASSSRPATGRATSGSGFCKHCADASYSSKRCSELPQNRFCSVVAGFTNCSEWKKSKCWKRTTQKFCALSTHAHEQVSVLFVE